MRKLDKDDYYWLLQATEQVSKDVFMQNLGEVYTHENIDLAKVKQILSIKLWEILKEKIKFMTSWEINYIIYATNDLYKCDHPIFSQRKLKKTCNTLLQDIMDSLMKHENTCAIQVYLRNVESDTYNNYVFFAS